MNDDASTSEPAPGTTTSPSSSTQNQNSSTNLEENESPVASLQKRAKERVLEQTKKRLEFLGNVMTNLDMLVYAELCVMYYMDNSFFRLLLRSLSQTLFLSPKPAEFPTLPAHAPYIPGLVLPNLFCILIHISTALPTATELTRSYLHGSVTIDFIGEMAPRTRFTLLVMDMVILGLQVFMLAVHVEEMRVKSVVKGDAPTENGTVNGSESANATTDTVPGQDHDAEERGVIRELAGSNVEDIEMQSLPSSSRTTQPHDTHEQEAAEETERLLEETVGSAAVEPQEGALDVFYSGNVVLADFHIFNTLKTVRSDPVGASESALQSVGHSTAYNWSRMQQRLQRLQGP